MICSLVFKKTETIRVESGFIPKHVLQDNGLERQAVFGRLILFVYCGLIIVAVNAVVNKAVLF